MVVGFYTAQSLQLHTCLIINVVMKFNVKGSKERN